MFFTGLKQRKRLIRSRFTRPALCRVSKRKSWRKNVLSTNVSAAFETLEDRVLLSVVTVDDYGSLPLAFEPNVGQTDIAVDFLARGADYTLYLTGTEAVWAVATPATVEVFDVPEPALDINEPVSDPSDPATLGPTVDVLRMRLVGSNDLTTGSGLDPLPGTSNYFIGNDPNAWHTDIPQFGRVEFQDVYPGIDVEFHGGQQILEYDFIVDPGVDPGAIVLEFGGVDNITLDDRGSLHLETAIGTITQTVPAIYQDGRIAVGLADYPG